METLTTKEAFVEHFKAIQEHVHDTAIDKGWHDDEMGLPAPGKRNMGEMVCNLHAELSEFWESWREPIRPESKQCPGFYNDEIELADLVIRLMDMAEAKGYRVAEAMVAKMTYNLSRERRHGGKKA